MSTTPDDIRRWLREAKADDATHMLVMVDEFDREDYPVSVKRGEDPRKVAKEKTGDMQRVMEFYALHLDLESQIAEFRSQHYEAAAAETETEKGIK